MADQSPFITYITYIRFSVSITETTGRVPYITAFKLKTQYLSDNPYVLGSKTLNTVLMAFHDF